MGVFKYSLALLALSGCSLIVESSGNYLQCEPETNACSPGYSCRVNECVKDGSQKSGDTCTADKHCADGLFCPPGISICAEHCDEIHSQNSSCGPDKACLPVRDRSNRGKFIGGACVPTECQGPGGDEYCKNNPGIVAPTNEQNGCIRLAQNGGICMLRCTPGLRAAVSAKGTDACVSDAVMNATHCGRVASGDYICVPAGNLVAGDKCTLYPTATSVPPDTCGLNVVNNTPGLPLLCIGPDGFASDTGDARCRIATCERDDQCPPNQSCIVENHLSFCRGATDQ